MRWNTPENNNPHEIKLFLVQFYREQYRVFNEIGIGGTTRFGVEITERLISCTANRLDQIIKGRKTPKNTCYPMAKSRLKGEPPLINSNRSFTGNTASKFDVKDLGKENELSVVTHTDYIYVSEKHRDSIEHTIYIDNIFTAYNSEIMMAILSHDN